MDPLNRRRGWFRKTKFLEFTTAEEELIALLDNGIWDREKASERERIYHVESYIGQILDMWFPSFNSHSNLEAVQSDLYHQIESTPLNPLNDADFNNFPDQLG